MSTITVTNIKATGETASRAVSGVAAAWCKRGGLTTPSILNSSNISSLTDINTGMVQYNFSNSFSDANHSIVAMGTDNSDGSNARINASTATTNTSSYGIVYTFNTYSLEVFKDCETHVSIHGDLA